MTKYSKYDTPKLKVLFIPAKGKFDVAKLNIKSLEKSGFKKFGLISSIQFVDELPKVRDYLKSKGFESEIGGQILGCRVEKAYAIKSKIDAFLYIGDGLFHPTALYRAGKPIFLYNGTELKEPKKNKAALTKFLHAEKVGILISTKHGQSFLHLAHKIKELYPEKEYFFFLSDTIDYNQMQNFPFVQAWVNTACNRIADDINVVNYEDIVLLHKSYEEESLHLVNSNKK